MQYITQCLRYSPRHHNAASAKTTTFQSQIVKEQPIGASLLRVLKKHQRTAHARLVAVSSCDAGGANRDRTDDLLLAKQALSQLSYGPVSTSRPPSRRSQEKIQPPSIGGPG